MFSFLRGGRRILLWLGSRGRVAALIAFPCFLATTAPAHPDSTSIDSDIHRSARSLCTRLPQVLSEMDSKAFRELLAPRDIRIELPAADPASTTPGIYSPEQAYFIVRDFLRSRELLAVASADTDAVQFIRSGDGRIGCECPTPRERGSQAHAIVHLSIRDAHGIEPLRRRLYVGLRRVDGSWFVAEIRELP